MTRALWRLARRAALATATVSILALTCVSSASSVSAAGGQPWQHHYFHINAYGAGLPQYYGCQGFKWSDGFGVCGGDGEHDTDSAPFDTYVQFSWWPASDTRSDGLCQSMGTEPPGYYRRVIVRSGNFPSSYLCGWVDWDWGAFDVTSGLFYYLTGKHYTVARTANASIGARGQPGGPLSLDLTFHGGGFSGHDGYALQIDGYMIENSCDEACLLRTPQ
jgi:hypothetical protein